MTGPRNPVVLALITDAASAADDYDMAPVVEACGAVGLDVRIVEWTDPTIEWDRYDAAILRSPWSYPTRLSDFVSWCEHVASRTALWNPIDVVRWNLDKTYLRDLSNRGVPVVRTEFSPAARGAGGIRRSIDAVRADHPGCDLVVKPSVGAYSRGVRRFGVDEDAKAVAHGVALLAGDREAMVQPYLDSIEDHGEVNLVFFGGELSHAITKAPLLVRAGPASEPTQDVRTVYHPSAEEVSVAQAALRASQEHTGTREPLLYARADLVDG
ncbi:MAG: ATP-grasp domain-containing protein, partial [Phycicoccus sp.]